MENKAYETISSIHQAEENRISNVITSFIVGGTIGVIGELIIQLLLMTTDISKAMATSYMIITLIFISALLTALGIMDIFVTKFKCGLIIPITGFAHSMMSASMEYKNEGFIYGIGSNIFKLAGSVIIYGVISAWFFGTIRYLIGG